MTYDVIIIGGGPAGMTAALNLKREGQSVLVLEHENFGGQIANSPRVENLPGIKAIAGAEFSNNLFEQMGALGAEFELEKAVKIEVKDSTFHVTTDYNEYDAKNVIDATGCMHKTLHMESEDKFAGNGVSYCAVCDGAFYNGKDVVVIGDANTALQYAILLSQYCNKVFIVTLFDKFFADDILVDRLKDIKNISYFHNYSTKEFYGNGTLEGVKFTQTQSKEELDIPCAGAFVAIGQKPDNHIFKDLVDLDKDGYVITDEYMHTKTPNLYAIGDCRVKKYRQVITAESDAAIAAIEISMK